MARAPLLRLSIALLASALTILGGCAAMRQIRVPGRVASPDEAARAYLRAWAAGDFAGMRKWMLSPPADLEQHHQRFQEGLHLLRSRFDFERVEPDAQGAAAVFRARHDVRGFGEWVYESRLALVRVEDQWRVRWTPTVLHPELQEGDTFGVERARLERAALLDGKGAPLTRDQDVVVVGLELDRLRSLEAVSAALHAKLGVDPLHVQEQLRASRGSAERFVPVMDIRPNKRFLKLRPKLARVPGVGFRNRRARLSLEDGFAAQVLGRMGAASVELAAELGPTYQPGDLVGLTGLEREYEWQLAGAPFGELFLVRKSGEKAVLVRFEGSKGTPVRTTLVPSLQKAADAALKITDRPAALVAVNSQTGAIVAVANAPAEQPLNRAFRSLSPPGTVFDVVTLEALLSSGIEQGARVLCPAKVEVGGKLFRNRQERELGVIPLRTAFTQSCRTAFATQGETLDSQRLMDSAAHFGFGANYRVGLPVAMPVFPEPVDRADRAAAAVGQGRVLATPLHMATVAAAVDSGKWRAPHLVAQPDLSPSVDLPRAVAGNLRVLMQTAATDDLALTYIRARKLAGKTGSAEAGSAHHAWFIGFRKGIAFAVLVEEGDETARSAVEIADRFARRW